MSHKSSRLYLLIFVGIFILFVSAGLQAQQSNQQFRGGGPILAQLGGTGPYLGNETGTNTWYGQNSAASLSNGIHNACFGWGTGNRTTGGTYPEGSRNAFFGSDAGQYNRTGNHNTFIGSAAGFSSNTGGFECKLVSAMG